MNFFKSKIFRCYVHLFILNKIMKNAKKEWKTEKTPATINIEPKPSRSGFHFPILPWHDVTMLFANKGYFRQFRRQWPHGRQYRKSIAIPSLQRQKIPFFHASPSNTLSSSLISSGLCPMASASSLSGSLLRPTDRIASAFPSSPFCEYSHLGPITVF